MLLKILNRSLSRVNIKKKPFGSLMSCLIHYKYGVLIFSEHCFFFSLSHVKQISVNLYFKCLLLGQISGHHLPAGQMYDLVRVQLNLKTLIKPCD